MAISTLVKYFQNDVQRFVYSLCGNLSVTDDLVQETFIKTFQQIKNLRNPAAFKGWLFQIAKNQAFSWMRSPSNKGESLEGVQEGSFESKQYPLTHLCAFIFEKMEPDDKAILLLIDMEGHEQDEVSTMLGINITTLRTRLHRARKKFEEIFMELEIDITDIVVSKKRYGAA